MKVTPTIAARADVVALVNFYDAKSGGHGDDFLAEFARALAAIEEAPRLRSLVEDPHPGFEAREYFIGRFKQRVIFVILNDEAFVVTVVHASRRLGAWHRRLDTLS